METKTDIVRLSSKGQLVIPRAIRKALRWEVGTELTVVQTGSGVTIQPLPKKTGKRLEDLRGCLNYQGRPLSDEELNAPVDYTTDWKASEKRSR
jgi:AbrB family looped-hinge helix DNA binding protein